MEVTKTSSQLKLECPSGLPIQAFQLFHFNQHENRLNNFKNIQTLLSQA